jgi:hypothetical protein
MRILLDHGAYMNSEMLGEEGRTALIRIAR